MGLAEIRESGLLELYVMNVLDEQEHAQVQGAIGQYPELKRDLEEIEQSLQCYAEAHAVRPDDTVKPMLMATIDYTERLSNGEIPGIPPILHEGSKVSDYSQWLEREDLNAPDDFDSIFARIIASETDKTTLIVWLRHGAPLETHHHEFEKFLIVEGSCDITIGSVVHPLKAGDYLSIPLHIPHQVKVTSLNPCKIVLQRVAA